MLGIIAGAGDLPFAVAEAAMDEGKSVFILALKGVVEESDFAAYPHASVSVGELGKIISTFKDAGCANITLAGKVTRPEVSQLRLDWKGMMALPGVLAASLKGDDALLRSLVGVLEIGRAHV